DDQLDAAQPSARRYGAARGVDEVEAADVERRDGPCDLAGDRLGRTDVERPVGDLAVILPGSLRGPAALRADRVHQRLVAGVVECLGLFIGLSDEAGRMHADRMRLGAELLRRAPVQ